jgi:hypothetical protein
MFEFKILRRLARQVPKEWFPGIQPIVTVLLAKPVLELSAPYVK